MKVPRSSTIASRKSGHLRMCTCSSSSSSRQPVNGVERHLLTGGHLSSSSSSLPPEVQRATIVMLGARGVGKTSLASQFTRSEFSDEYRPTATRICHYVSVLINDRIYEVKLIDCSSVSRFPSTSLQEWTEHRGSGGLLSASAYLLVYDATDDASFLFVRSMRDQILRARHNSNHSAPQHEVPIFVAANKQDLLLTSAAAGGGGDSGGGGRVSSGPAGPAAAAKTRADAANVVRKQWKCGFVECSTKHNWRVTALFRELIRAIDHARCGHHHHRPASTRALQDAFRNKHCAIL